MSANDFEERVVTVPLRDVQAVPAHERAGRSMTLIREHLAKHFKVDADAVRLDTPINEAAWARGRANTPSKIRVRAARFEEEGEAIVEAETASNVAPRGVLRVGDVGVSPVRPTTACWFAQTSTNRYSTT